MKSGGREGIRTPGLLVANEALSQLSYSPTSSREILANVEREAKRVYESAIRESCESGGPSQLRVNKTAALQMRPSERLSNRIRVGRG
jgi:hypothetical protein